MNNNKIQIALAVCIVGVFALFGLKAITDSNKEAANANKEVKNVKLAYQSDEYITDALIDLADKKGYLKKNNITIEKSTALTNINAALSSGEVDAQVSSVAISLLNYLNDKDFVMVDKLGERPPLHGLVGKVGETKDYTKAAVSKLGGATTVYSEVVASNLNMNGKIEYSVAASGAPQVAAIEKGIVDYTITNVYNDDLLNAIKGKNMQVIEPADVWKGKKVPFGIVTTKKKLDKSSESIKGLVLSLNAAQDYAKKHQLEFRAMLKDKNKLSDEIADKILKAFVATASADHKLSESDLQDALPAIKTLKPSNSGRNLAEYIDNRFLK